ncbi:hypothetical protein Acr_00g0086540 [Actinidia rufa]|uniref:Transposase (putative) gypsy type domain-containing protein n=1 Tax=Actinidia rufa TaxID=165716 RepID=A0A7J0DXL8_9ERIC|nr:hypothetical protein Acr_00g0086540 [Actinidia rufa]
MADEVNQRSLPPEESYPWERLLEIEVPSSPTTKLNIMTQGDLNHLWETYSFPLGVWIRIPKNGKTVLSASYGEVVFYEAAFPVGLRFPMHPTIKRILNFYDICLAQLSPNAWRSILSVLVIWPFYRRHLSLNKFRCLYALFKGPGSKSGWLYFKARPVEISSSSGGTVEGDIGGEAKGDIRGRVVASVGDASESSYSKDVPRLELLSQFAKVVAEKTVTFSSKGIVISEAFEMVSKEKALDDESKGKQVAPFPEVKKIKAGSGTHVVLTRPPILREGSTAKSVPSKALGPHVSVMSSAVTTEKILAGVILPANKEKVEKLTFNQVVTKFLHILGQALAEVSSEGKKATEEVEAKNKEVTRLEARVADWKRVKISPRGGERLLRDYIEMDRDFLAKEEAGVEEREGKTAKERGEKEVEVEEGGLSDES